ncbi:aldehyde dehydrogenase family protein [Corynebacterium variabile]|uniref:aldehyde dehydrogenase family protein n=1 Tax=Corynebacterium variabile TaxID=1727 RepID=UPI00289774F4|nr:aldehyde dehydrogenase family protein [Corynebacterium variabile]
MNTYDKHVTDSAHPQELTEEYQGDHLTVRDPATGEVVTSVPSAAGREVSETLAASCAAARTWRAVSADERAGYLRRAADAVAAAVEELADLNHRETGKTLEDSRGGVTAGVDTLRQYAETAPVHRGHSLQGARGAADYTVSRPRGVVVALTPWNDPVAVAAGLIGAALVTGNTVIHKPSERCPGLGQRLGALLEGVFPDGVFRTLTGGPDLGALLSRDLRVDVLAHVGSTRTGRALAAAGAQTGAHVIRENGGNDALVIDRGTDIDVAVEQTVTGCFANAGQICTSVERVYVHDDVAERYLNHLVLAVGELDAVREAQPLVDRRHREEVHRQVTQAVEEGASLLAGGWIPEGPGAFYPLTVLSGCRPEMAVMSEETFGPVAAVQRVSSFREGLELAENDRFGLAATVLTPDLNAALEAVASLTVGTVKVNEVFGGAPGGSAQPRKDSGEGFGFGPELLDEMVTTTVVHLAALPGQQEAS